MKLGSGRRTRSRADGRNAEPGHLRRTTRGLRRPIFSVQSVRPKDKGAGLVLPSCDSEAMALHLEEISITVAPGAHAILLLDQAGWHVSKKLPIPDNITLLPFPPKSPELNPVENIWQFMRDNWLSNRIFKSHEDILDHCCFAWNKLIDMPWKIMSIGIRDWAYRS
jgi:DDE superfamily endonuclease